MSITENAAKYANIPPVNKNYILNGMLQIWQRGTFLSATTTGDYIADRFFLGFIGVARGNLSEQVISTANGRSELRFGITTADTSVAVSDNVTINTVLEGSECEAFKFGKSDAKDLTLSFYHAHSVVGTYTCCVRNHDKNRVFVFEYEQAVTNVWEQTAVTIPGDTTGTWTITENSRGLQILWTCMAGSSYHNSTVDAWNTTNKFSTSNQVNNAGTIGNLFRFSNIKLEIGSEATEAIQEDFVTELMRCKRFYQSNFNYGTYPSNTAGHTPASPNVTAINATTYYANIVFAVPMADPTPTMFYYKDNGGTKSGAWTILVGSWQASTAVNGNVILSDSNAVCSNGGHTFTTGYSYTSRGFWTAESLL